MTENIDLGTTSAKYASTDLLIQKMRQILREHDLTRSEAISAFIEAVRAEDDLLQDALIYVGNLMWSRCAERDRNKNEEKNSRAEKAAENIIRSKIVLWTTRLPQTGKRLPESTFAEVEEAAPLLGRFYARLALRGKPGQLVSEIFDRKSLQEFWNEAQRGDG